MKKIMTTFAAALFAAFASAQSYAPIPQGRLNATASSQYGAAGPGNALNLTIGQGLDANGMLGSLLNTMWVNTGGEANPWFRVNLGQDTILAAIKLWNFNGDGHPLIQFDKNQRKQHNDSFFNRSRDVKPPGSQTSLPK